MGLKAGPDRSQLALADCISRSAVGDRHAFEELYRRSSAKLFGVCLRILSDRAEAEDALQEAFVLAWRRAASFDPGRGSAMTWLMTIARNCAIDRRRASGKIRAAPIEWADTIPDPAVSAVAHFEEGEEERAMRRCLEELDARDVRLITAAFYDGNTYADLARRSDSPLGTVKSRIRRALLTLRECLK